MAIGTIASRGTGFLRTVIIGLAIGYPVGESYNVANTVPNILYDLLLGGLLSAVVVPLLVQAAHDDGDEGDAYAQRLLTLVTVALTALAVIAVLAAPLIVSLYAGHLRPSQQHLATTFARYFLPQLVFYGLGATYGAILNVRGSFAAPMWAPVLNNLVVIASGIAFLAVTTGRPRPGHLSHTQTLVLAIGTTAGVVAQTVALLPALRRAGFRMRWRTDFKALGLARSGKFAAWILGYVATNQLGYVVIVNLATASSKQHGTGGGGYSPYTYAFVLFSLPYAVVGVTVITALFPQMSRNAAAGDEPAVATSLAEGLSLAAVLLVPATAALLVLGPLLATVALAHGRITVAGARLAGEVLAGFGAGLVPFSAFQMQLRAWLAVRDAKTPFLVNLLATAVNVVADIVLYELLPGRAKLIGLAVGFSLSYFVGSAVFTVLLRRRMTASRPTHVIRTHVRLVVAAGLATIPTVVAARILTGALGERPVGALVSSVLAAGLGGVVFVALARRMRVRELATLVRLLPGR